MITFQKLCLSFDDSQFIKNLKDKLILLNLNYCQLTNLAFLFSVSFSFCDSSSSYFFRISVIFKLFEYANIMISGRFSDRHKTHKVTLLACMSS